MRGLIWFREDLRVSDNTALYQAVEQCPDGVLAVYLIDPEQWKKHGLSAARVNFHLQGLIELAASLKKLHIPLIALSLEKTADAPQQLLEICQRHQLQALFYNRQYEVNEQARDRAVTKKLMQQGIRCFAFDDQCIIAPGKLLTQSGAYFKVFTPFKRCWLQYLTEHNQPLLLPEIKIQPDSGITGTAIPERIAGFDENFDRNLWPPGEIAAQARLKTFIKQLIISYHHRRDFPAEDGTSCLSPYLTAGMLSARQCLQAVKENYAQDVLKENSGAATWISELIWRDFYKHILWAVPRVSMNLPYKLVTKKLIWRNDPQLLAAWQQGQTGIPIIDAAMRQLNQTAWMHNRLRMITAMFLAKNLFLDWRLGEAYFMSRLIDGDLAANNGGWQWCASTGVDAVPYFRVFNPIRQSEKFDPQGIFIRHYCPELKKLDNKTIHDPSRRGADLHKLGYPAAIVDVEKTRKQAISAYKKLAS